MMLKNWIGLFFISLLLCVSGIKCTAQSKKGITSAGYNLSAPEVIKLPKEINQISGITYYAPHHSVFAIDDDHGDLYEIPLQQNPTVSKWKFAGKDDYEDLVLLHNTFYIQSSEGLIVSFPFSFPITKTTTAKLGAAGRNEFEILYADAQHNRLISICKDCAVDSKGTVSAYSFDLAKGVYNPAPVLSFTKKDIEEKLGKKIDRFKPSGATTNPKTGEVYIVSSINKLLVVTTPDLKVKEVYELDPTLYKQPEGICFTSDGDLLISNEGAKEGNATILVMKRK